MSDRKLMGIPSLPRHRPRRLGIEIRRRLRYDDELDGEGNMHSEANKPLEDKEALRIIDPMKESNLARTPSKLSEERPWQATDAQALRMEGGDPKPAERLSPPAHAREWTTATAASAVPGSEPPACAKSGRTPPPPPTIAAASRTISPALCFEVTSLETEQTRSAFPLFSAPRTTTAGARRSRS